MIEGLHLISINVTFVYTMTGFGKTDHNVTIDILRNIDLKY